MDRRDRFTVAEKPEYLEGTALDRRGFENLLKATGALAFAPAVAGCSSDGDESGDGTAGTDATDGGNSKGFTRPEKVVIARPSDADLLDPHQTTDAGVELDLIEQPVPADDVAGLADVRRRIDVPVGADETVFTPADAVRVVRAEAADAINVKLGKSGPLAVSDIVSIAQGANLDLMIGCMLEGAIGIHTGAHVVAGTGAFSYVDLDGNRLLAEDVVPTEEGPIHDISGAGHGITPGAEWL